MNSSASALGGGVLKYVAVCNREPVVGRVEYDSGNNQRGSANLKEVVGSADLIEIKRLFKGFAEEFLGLICGSDIFSERYRYRLGELADIGFAVRGHRHFRHLQISCRHHIMRKVLFQLIAQSVYIYFFIGSKVSAKVILTVELADNNGCFLDVGLFSDKPLNFAELNTQTS